MHFKVNPNDTVSLSPRITRFSAGITIPCALALISFLLAMSPVFATGQLPENPTQANIIFHVTDFGISQWHQEFRSGQDFGPRTPDGPSPNLVYTDLCGASNCAANILLVMPDNDSFDNISQEKLRAQLLDQLRTSLDVAIADGFNEFEIQLVQNINYLGYVDPKQQSRVREFGRAAYQAIGEVRQNLMEKKQLSIYTDATVGSNGTVMLTENTDSWSSYLQAVDLIDGRASMQATIKTIDAIRNLTGHNNVRILTAKGDHLAANRPQAWLLDAVRRMNGLGQLVRKGPNISIGNAQVVAEIMRQRPQTEGLVIERLDRSDLPFHKRLSYFGKLFPGTGHIAAMSGRHLGESLFRAQQIIPNKRFGFRVNPGTVVSYQDLRARGGSSISRLYDLTRTVTPTAISAPTPIGPSSANRGGVLIAPDAKAISVDLSQLRERILNRPDDASLTWEVDSE